jgi:GH35 family endo-1,4-beta-xylanase
MNLCFEQGEHLMAAVTTAMLAGVFLAALATPVCAAGEGLLSDEAIDARIQKLRTAEATLTVTDAGGKPLANAEVVVTMRRHRFLFGCNIFSWGELKDPKLEAAYRARFVELLNYATLPFYWGSYEREEGQTQQAHLRAMAEWCRAQGIRTKGHPLVWHEVPAKWHEGLDLETLRHLQLARVTREVTTFAGRIDIWDVVNEPNLMVDSSEPIGRLCRAMGVKELVSAAFDAAHAANPKATLVLNEAKHDEDFIAFVGRCLEAKVPIDIVGLQSHMAGGYIGAQRVWNMAEMFAHIGRPEHWTEASIVSGRLKTWKGFDYVKDWDSTPEGEKRQAEEVANFYRVLFSHPAVEAVTWWDFSDHDTWQGAPAGLLRKDMSPKPSYDALLKLVKGQWWTGPLKLTSDAAGRVTFRGFLGDYELRAGGAAAEFRLDAPGKAAVAVATKGL